MEQFVVVGEIRGSAFLHPWNPGNPWQMLAPEGVRDEKKSLSQFPIPYSQFLS
jgi:hypothetical protein